MAVRVKRLSLGWSGNPRHIRPVPQPPRELAKRYFNVVHWAEHERGGHFPAVAEPRLLAERLREAFRPAGRHDTRVARFGEFVELVGLLLRQEVTTYHGQFYRCQEAETVPLPVQQPRPPVTIAVHGPKMLRIAAEQGDGWSSWGGYDVATEEAFYAVTADRSHRFDDLCVAAGRDPASIRHSLVCFPPLTPCQSVEYFQDMVGRFRQIGIDEFVLYWPQTWGAAPREEAVFEEVTATVMPRLRAGDDPVGGSSQRSRKVTAAFLTVSHSGPRVLCSGSARTPRSGVARR